MLNRTIPITLILLWTIALFIPGLCLAQNESEATYTVIEELDVKVTMRDGVRL